LIDEPQLLEDMLEDLGRQREMHRPGPYWQDYARRIAAALREDGLARFRANARVGRGFVDVFAGEPTWRDRPGAHRAVLSMLLRLPLAATWYERRRRALRARQLAIHADKQGRYARELEPWFARFAAGHDLPPTEEGAPERTVTLAGRRVGEIYLRTFAWADALAPHVELARARTVLEIGGGFGAMAHTLLHLYPNIRKYVYLDIPPVLYVGTQYLKRFFPGQVHDYAATRHSPRLGFADDDTREVLAIAPWQLERLEAGVELFWNSSSFQEMPAPVVAHYARHVGHLLVPGGHAACYVYTGGATNRTLAAAAVTGAFEAQAGIALKPVEAPVAAAILPGALYVGRR
jgi:putative sugar O-methyltransferase